MATSPTTPGTPPPESPPPETEPPALQGLEYEDISKLAEKMAAGSITSATVTQYLLDRIAKIDKSGPMLNAVIELNPDALAIAQQRDEERAQGIPRGPLHGIPIMLKDNIDTADQMQTTAGSLAMVGQPASEDAFIVKKLRDAGAVILGKTNLSEWAYYRDLALPSGWSGRGGQTKNPHVLSTNPCGSSAGSGVAVAAGLSPAAIGTETNGSIICPAAKNGIVGLRPTLGLLSRTGIIPITSAQDTPGPMARSVRDAAILLTAMVGRDLDDTATLDADFHAIDYAELLRADGLKGMRIGYPRGKNPGGASGFEKALAKMQDAGATLVPVESPSNDRTVAAASASEKQIFAIDFKRQLNSYLAGREGLSVRTLADIIAFNEKTPGTTPNGTVAGQRLLESAELTHFDLDAYEKMYDAYKSMARNAIDTALNEGQLDALVDEDPGVLAPMAGYPGITVPSGMNKGMPEAVYFYGPRWSDAKLLSIAYAFEQATLARRNPAFLPAPPDSDPM